MDLRYTAHVPGGVGPFPTVIALHGWGANAHDLLGLAQVLHRGEALMLCPEGPVSMQIGDGMVGHGWYPIAGGGAREHPEFEAAARALRDFLELAVERYPVDRNKLIILGFSQGGVMAYDLFLREPERFAALIALSSWLPAEIATLAGCGESDWVGRDASDGRRAEQGEGSPFPVRTGSVSHG